MWTTCFNWKHPFSGVRSRSWDNEWQVAGGRSVREGIWRNRRLVEKFALWSLNYHDFQKLFIYYIHASWPAHLATLKLSILIFAIKIIWFWSLIFDLCRSSEISSWLRSTGQWWRGRVQPRWLLRRHFPFHTPTYPHPRRHYSLFNYRNRLYSSHPINWSFASFPPAIFRFNEPDRSFFLFSFSTIQITGFVRNIMHPCILRSRIHHLICITIQQSKR